MKSTKLKLRVDALALCPAKGVAELEVIASKLDIPAVRPESLGANITFSGLEELTAVPRGTTIWFPGGAILSVEDENKRSHLKFWNIRIVTCANDNNVVVSEGA